MLSISKTDCCTERSILALLSVRETSGNIKIDDASSGTKSTTINYAYKDYDEQCSRVLNAGCIAKKDVLAFGSFAFFGILISSLARTY